VFKPGPFPPEPLTGPGERHRKLERERNSKQSWVHQCQQSQQLDILSKVGTRGAEKQREERTSRAGRVVREKCIMLKNSGERQERPFRLKAALFSIAGRFLSHTHSPRSSNSRGGRQALSGSPAARRTWSTCAERIVKCMIGRTRQADERRCIQSGWPPALEASAGRAATFAGCSPRSGAPCGWRPSAAGPARRAKEQPGCPKTAAWRSSLRLKLRSGRGVICMSEDGVRGSPNSYSLRLQPLLYFPADPEPFSSPWSLKLFTFAHSLSFCLFLCPRMS
jgi:hypothetical protein